MNSVKRIALVTGGNRGIGYEICRQLAELGYIIILTSRDESKGCKAAGELSKNGAEVHYIQLDVTSEEAIYRTSSFVRDKFNRLDILINNAGMSPLYPKLSDISEELFDKVIGVNLKGPFRLSALVGERMAAGDGGAIINISSTASLNQRRNASVVV